MTGDRPRCSAESVARDEPVFATASLVSSWLLIEQSGAWGPDALTDSKFPDDVAAELESKASGVRILLIRHRTASGADPVYFKAHSGGEGSAPSLVVNPLPDPSVLLALDMEALSGGDTGPGTPVDHPLFLVCTHGRHDICCADNGRPLYRAMSSARPDRTWEVSHLGGDRFAGNLLVLPRGDYFGRVSPEDAEGLVSSYESGRLDLAHHRGRSIQPRLVQAAEHLVRESHALDRFDDLTLTAYRRPEHDLAEVVFRWPDGSVRVEVAARHQPQEVYMTCRAENPGHPVAYDLVSMTSE